MARILLISVVFFSAIRLSASSCCGQTPTSYTVLYQRQKSSLFASYSSLTTQGRVFENQDFMTWPNEKKRQVETYQFQGAMSLSTWSQLFWSTGFLTSSFDEGLGVERSQHLSDTQIGLTYELLSEYVYSPWKPVIYGSLFLNVPTGRSLFANGGLTEGTDVTGHEQWGGGVGITFHKVIFPMTLIAQFKALQLLEQNFDSVEISGFNDVSAATFLSYSTSYWGLSGSFGWTWNRLSSRRISVSSIPSGVSEVHTLSISLQKSISDNMSISIGLADQTLFGKARNTLLNQMYSLNINYNFF
jgi:hypothetical protein